VNAPVIAIAPTPAPGPYAQVVWAPGYSLANVCGSAVPLTVNAANGQVSVIADLFGLYAMAVTVTEYRNGVPIGLVRREIEFAVVVCQSALPQTSLSVGPGTGSGFPVNPAGNVYPVYETDTLCLWYQAFDPTDSLRPMPPARAIPG
jgi:hypothetical protein